MYTKEKTVCFSGHRNNRLPQTAKEMNSLKARISKEIDRAVHDGFNTFLFGACYGFDLICAEIVLNIKNKIKPENSENIRVVAVVPFEEQAAKWNDSDRETYYNTLAKCDDVVTLSLQYAKDCYNKRNKYMADNSGRLICYFDGGSGGTCNTVEYAKQSGVEIVNLYE
jgi:uncharacterized phage-like protein YoqJ